MRFLTNYDVAAAVDELVRRTDVDWVLNEQQVTWKEELWRRQWARTPQLPHAQGLDRLAAEVGEYDRIRRNFLFGLADENVPLLIAAMVWGYGPNNLGPARTCKA